MSTPKFDLLDCPVCDGVLRRIDVPNLNLHQCDECKEIVQEIGRRSDGGSSLIPIGGLLKRNELGDDRVRAAISTPEVSSIRSFLDVFDMACRMLELNIAEAKGGLRTILTQLENRIDFAIQRLTGLDFASDAVGDALQALREARNLASVLPGRSRGVMQKGDNAGQS